MWEINAAIMANTLQLALVDQGLASCWVHVGEYRTIGDDPTSQRSEDFIKERLPEIPAQYRILCVIGIGYADYTPKPLPEYEGPERLLYVK
jgi:nitroreductase